MYSRLTTTRVRDRVLPTNGGKCGASACMSGCRCLARAILLQHAYLRVAVDVLDIRHDVAKVERGEVLFAGVSAEPRNHISEQVEGRKVFEATMAGHVARLEILDRVPRPGLQRREEDAEAHLILQHGVPTIFYDRIVAAAALAQHPLKVSTRRLVADKDGQVYVAEALFPAPLPRVRADSVVFLRRHASPRHLSCMRALRAALGQLGVP